VTDDHGLSLLSFSELLKQELHEKPQSEHTFYSDFMKKAMMGEI